MGDGVDEWGWSRREEDGVEECLIEVEGWRLIEEK